MALRRQGLTGISRIQEVAYEGRVCLTPDLLLSLSLLLDARK